MLSNYGTMCIFLLHGKIWNTYKHSNLNMNVGCHLVQNSPQDVDWESYYNLSNVVSMYVCLYVCGFGR